MQDKVTAAHRVLVSEEKRRQYLSFLLLKFELAGVRSPGIVLDAELALKRGERALRARRNEEAVGGAARRPSTSTRASRSTWPCSAFAELHAPGQPAADRARAALRHGRAALELDPGHPRALVVLALAEAWRARRERRAAQAAAAGVQGPPRQRAGPAEPAGSPGERRLRTPGGAGRLQARHPLPGQPAADHVGQRGDEVGAGAERRHAQVAAAPAFSAASLARMSMS